jgi:glucokinase
MKEYAIGFDLGGTKMLCLLVDSAGKVVARVKAKTQGEGNSSKLIQSIVECIRDTLAQTKLELADVAGIGLGVPGPVDWRNGVVQDMPNLGIKNFPLRELLEKELKVPVKVENDVNSGTFAEYKLGVGRDFRYIVGIFPGTGIGGGLILDGTLYRGATGGAGEVGHMIVQVDGRACNCGRYGCLEASASRTALAKDLAALVSAGKIPSMAKAGGSKFEDFRSGAIAKAVAAGDQNVVRLVKRAARFLGVGMANCVNMFNPEAVIIGGGLVEKLGDMYLKEAERSMREHAMPNLVTGVKVLAAALGDDAVALGSALLVREGA